MKSLPYFLIAIVLVTGACSPYPRYRTGGPMTTRAAQPLSSLTTEQSLRLGAILQEYLGRPYKGRSRYEEGIDCSEFVQEVFEKYDRRQLPRTSQEQFSLERKVPRNRLLYGDLVFFETNGKNVSHVGIYVGGGKFMHASESSGVIITRMNDTYWAKRFAGAVRILP